MLCHHHTDFLPGSFYYMQKCHQAAALLPKKFFLLKCLPATHFLLPHPPCARLLHASPAPACPTRALLPVCHRNRYAPYTNGSSARVNCGRAVVHRVKCCR